MTGLLRVVVVLGVLATALNALVLAYVIVDGRLDLVPTNVANLAVCAASTLFLRHVQELRGKR